MPTSSRGHRASRWSADPHEAFDPAEFAEFLEADDSPLPADPAFKERLRQRLWSMVRENADAARPSASPSPIGVGRSKRPLLDSDPKPKPHR